MKATEYLVTLKEGNTVLKQTRLSEEDAFRVLRGVFIGVYPETSSAEIALMNAKAKLKEGKPQGMEFMGKTIIFQVA